MGNVAAAVAEFDEAVQAPWRPPLVAVDGGRRDAGRTAPSGHARSRVGACRPVEAAAPVPTGRTVHPGYRPSREVRGGSSRSRTAVPPAGREAGRARDLPAVRLTRRARRLGAALGLAIGVALGSWLGAALAGDAGSELQLAGESSVVVRTGDSVWSIARSIAGDSDVRPVVDAIQSLNGLEGGFVVPGQVLRLP
jgi:nucleoid-associated protein YgaU